MIRIDLSPILRYFIFILLFDPSWSESIRVDLVRLLYLPLPMCYFVGNFSCSWILKDCIHVQKEKGEFVVVCSWEFMSSVKCCIRKFHIVIVQWMSKKCTKKSVVLLIKPVVFLFTSSFSSSSWLLKLLLVTYRSKFFLHVLSRFILPKNLFTAIWEAF